MIENKGKLQKYFNIYLILSVVVICESIEKIKRDNIKYKMYSQYEKRKKRIKTISREV